MWPAGARELVKPASVPSLPVFVQKLFANFHKGLLALVAGRINHKLQGYGQPGNRVEDIVSRERSIEQAVKVGVKHRIFTTETQRYRERLDNHSQWEGSYIGGWSFLFLKFSLKLL